MDPTDPVDDREFSRVSRKESGDRKGIAASLFPVSLKSLGDRERACCGEHRELIATSLIKQP